MSAMGLDHGGGGGGGGDKKLEGITTPPKGKAVGIATPDVKKTLEDKTKLMQKAGLPVAPENSGGGGRGAKAAPPPPAGGAPKAAPPPPGAAKAPPGAPGAGGHAPGGDHAKAGQAPGGDHASAPHAPGGDHASAPHAPGDKPAPAAAHGGGPPAAHGDGAPSVDALIAELEHGTDPGARIKAAEALARSRSPKAKVALEKAIHDHDSAVAAAAKKALGQLGTAH